MTPSDAPASAPNLRIGMLAPISWRVPPRHYGPWEKIVSDLTEGLGARGVEVTLFATADSLTKAKLHAVCPRPYSEDSAIDAKVWECLHDAEAFRHAHEFDLLHNHFDFLPLTYSSFVKTPVLTTIHGFSSPRILPVFEKYNRATHYVAISDSDRAPSLDYIATIHHGIRIQDFEFTPAPQNYLLFFGRIHPEKGAAEAIAIAKKMRRPLVLAGIVQDQRYFDERVKPELNNDITYIGPVGGTDRSRVLGGASALLHLISFDEPFGLSVVEAMACGTPVIACDRGSMPELIRHGGNGMLVAAPEDAAEVLGDVEKLDRRKIRASVERRFSVERMVDDYIRVYRQILGR